MPEPAPSPAPGGVDFLAHRRGDDVAVVVRDTGPGPARAAYLDSGDRFEITGQGNVVGHPVEPVIKISANPLTLATMSEHIDVDVTRLHPSA